MSAIRALANDLAGRSDPQLRALLEARPDLALPPVPDFSALAARASTRVSVQRALENLSEPQLHVLEAIELTASVDSQLSTTASWLRKVIRGSTIRIIDSVISELHALALIRQAPPPPDTPAVDRSRRFYLPSGPLHEALGPYPAGLGRSTTALARLVPGYGALLVDAMARLRSDGVQVSAADSPVAAARALDEAVSDPDTWDRLLLLAPERTAELLDRFSGSPVGAVPGRQAGVDGDPDSPLVWLLNRGLLTRLDAAHVELPRAVGQAARGHVIVPRFRPAPPAAAAASVRTSLRDNAAYSAVAETLRLVTELLGTVEESAVTTLRSGGVGVREIRRLADALRVDGDQAVWLVELAALSGLLILDVDTSSWHRAAETRWHCLEREEQWRLLVTAWLDAGRAPSLVGAKLPTGVTVNALAAEANRPDAPGVRRRMLTTLLALTGEAAADDGESPVFDAAAVIARLSWHQPRLHRRFGRLVPGMMGEAAHLGLLGSGSLTELGALLAEGRHDDASAALSRALPDPLNHFMLQADLTAVAPGYLQPAVAHELALLSSAEGQGPATTYRFSADSIRRALDAGQNADGIMAFLSRHAATEVPQPLRYLVEDTAARYGRLRVGHAASYVRSDDDAALSALIADPRAAGMGLVQLAPTVVAAQATGADLAGILRELGYSPALEGQAALVARPAALTPSSSRSHPARTLARSLSAEDIALQLAVLRGSGSITAAPASAGESETLLGLETLRKAIRLKSPVRLGFADNMGNSTRQVFVPLSVSGGRVRVFDPQKEVERVVSIHRVMDVELVEGAPTDV